MNILRLFTKPNPGRDLALLRIGNERKLRLAVARRIRAETGLPPDPRLEA